MDRCKYNSYDLSIRIIIVEFRKEGDITTNTSFDCNCHSRREERLRIMSRLARHVVSLADSGATLLNATGRMILQKSARAQRIFDATLAN